MKNKGTLQQCKQLRSLTAAGRRGPLGDKPRTTRTLCWASPPQPRSLTAAGRQGPLGDKPQTSATLCWACPPREHAQHARHSEQSGKQAVNQRSTWGWRAGGATAWPEAGDARHGLGTRALSQRGRLQGTGPWFRLACPLGSGRLWRRSLTGGRASLGRTHLQGEPLQLRLQRRLLLL